MMPYPVDEMGCILPTGPDGRRIGASVCCGFLAAGITSHFAHVPVFVMANCLCLNNESKRQETGCVQSKFIYFCSPLSKYCFMEYSPEHHTGFFFYGLFVGQLIQDVSKNCMSTCHSCPAKIIAHILPKDLLGIYCTCSKVTNAYIT